MNCPRCGKQMEMGYLSAGGYRILWTPKESKMSAIPGKEDVVLQHMELFGANEAIAHICKSCKTIIVDY